MSISIFDLFTIGMGPSSSHTVGPMRAAKQFVQGLENDGFLSDLSSLQVFLYGSLALTGKGHGTDTAVLLGFMGEEPETVDVDTVSQRLDAVYESGDLTVLEAVSVGYAENETIVFVRKERLPHHANGMRFVAKDTAGAVLKEAVYYSIGGGFIASEAEMEGGELASDLDDRPVPYPFKSGEQILEHCESESKSISELVYDNELVWRDAAVIDVQLQGIWQAMQDCVSKGCATEGILPGGLDVKRRAYAMHQDLLSRDGDNDPGQVMDWVSLFALAVNEENAAGGRVVTAPTNGAAGIVPAVLHYYAKYYQPLDAEQLRVFFFTAGAIGMLYKLNASISGAEMGCQGEVGVACSMAAAGLCALRGGTPSQVESAAEIGMEHNLGLTCDPVKGLVQIPCIERNTMGAIKAINAARLALAGDGSQKVSLDKVIRTMRQTGEDMKSRYKETSEGGLATNVVEC